MKTSPLALLVARHLRAHPTTPGALAGTDVPILSTDRIGVALEELRLLDLIDAPEYGGNPEPSWWPQVSDARLRRPAS
ncbi:hypothetical protein ABT404_39130 [Streptomyces hyaluromycini]|uniref:DprA winged helix domain-containing protein n=1 Tax=Streptomyces hyaluromycini TaxID=1377993 RepID=A0ABV1X8Q0_9ACTN